MSTPLPTMTEPKLYADLTKSWTDMVDAQPAQTPLLLILPELTASNKEKTKLPSSLLDQTLKHQLVTPTSLSRLLPLDQSFSAWEQPLPASCSRLESLLTSNQHKTLSQLPSQVKNPLSSDQRSPLRQRFHKRNPVPMLSLKYEFIIPRSWRMTYYDFRLSHI